MNTNVICHQPAELYYKRILGEVSKSGLDQFSRSPAHYKAWCDGIENEPTEAMIFGTAFHTYVLERGIFFDKYTIAPNDLPRRPTSAQINAKKPSDETVALIEFWREFDYKNGGRILLQKEDHDRILAMSDSIMRHPIAKNLIMGGEREVTLRWTDDKTGLECKARCDYWLDSLKVAFDLKTTVDASPKSFSRSIFSYRYHVQDAFYRRGFSACGSPIEHFLFAPIEKDAPYLATVCHCDDAAVERAEQLVEVEMARLAECVKTNTWGGYGDEIVSMALPAYAFYD